MVSPMFMKPGGQGDSADGPERIWNGRTGRIIGADAQGRPLVDFEGNTGTPRVARKVVALDSGTLRSAIESGCLVELRFEDGDSQLPIIVSLLPAKAESPAWEAEPADEAATSRIIEGQDELVLQCGKASITLRRNGKVIIKGAYVETYSEGVNRIKGGSIQFG